MNPSERSSTASGLPLAVGLAALTGGLWLFLNAMGVGVPSFKDLWPILLILAGAASLADLFFLSRRPAAAGWAVTWIGFGVLAFALTLDWTSWGRILDWLPSFPTILGLAFLATCVADKRRRDQLAISGGVLLALGLVGFTARFEWLRRLMPSAQVLWAGLLVLVGGYLVWRTVARGRRRG